MTTRKPPPGHFNLLYFASASTYTKKNSEHFAAPLEASKLFEVLEGKYPGMKSSILSSCAVTINLEYVDMEGDEDEEELKEARVIQEGDEVAIIPPVSSG